MKQLEHVNNNIITCVVVAWSRGGGVWGRGLGEGAQVKQLEHANNNIITCVILAWSRGGVVWGRGHRWSSWNMLIII